MPTGTTAKARGPLAATATHGVQDPVLENGIAEAADARVRGESGDAHEHGHRVGPDALARIGLRVERGEHGNVPWSSHFNFGALIK